MGGFEKNNSFIFSVNNVFLFSVMQFEWGIHNICDT